MENEQQDVVDVNRDKENYYEKNTTGQFFGKNFEKQSYNPKEFEQTKTVLFRKDFKNLDEENEKIQLLNKHTKNLEVNLENLLSQREEAKRQLEQKFDDIYYNIEQTKKTLYTEGTRLRNQFFDFQERQRKSVIALNDRHLNLKKQLEENTQMRFEEISNQAQLLKEGIDEEIKNRKESLENFLSQFNERMEQMDNSIKEEKNIRTEEYNQLSNRVDQYNSEIIQEIDDERNNRINDFDSIKQQFWYRMDEQKKYSEYINEKIKGELNHVTVNLNKEMQHRLTQQDDLIENLGHVVETLQKTFNILKET